MVRRREECIPSTRGEVIGGRPRGMEGYPTGATAGRGGESKERRRRSHENKDRGTPYSKDHVYPVFPPTKFLKRVLK